MPRLDASRWLSHLDRARRVALEGVDPEGVHQVRVAARRLRAWLTLGGHRALHDDLRWLCRSLSEARDLDIFGEVLDGEAMQRRRADAQAEVRATLESRRYEGLRRALGLVPPPPRRAARARLRALERRLEVRRSAVRFPLTVRQLERVHALRRALRRVRYAREWLGLDTAELSREQEWLGTLCDLTALARFVSLHAPDTSPLVEAGLTRALAVINKARPS